MDIFDFEKKSLRVTHNSAHVQFDNYCFLVRFVSEKNRIQLFPASTTGKEITIQIGLFLLAQHFYNQPLKP